MSSRRISVDAEPRPLRANRDFRLLWIGQVLSDLGSEIGMLAYPLLVLALTHSVVVAGTVGTVASIAAFVVRLPAGALADRLDRRRTMIWSDVVRAAALGVLALLAVLGGLVWPIVMIVAAIDRVGATLFAPAATAALPMIVADEQLEAAFAATEARQYAANLVGPALGGLLFGIGRVVPFVVDAVSYGISFLTSARMEGQFAVSRIEPRRGLWSEAMEGVRLLWRNPLLRALLIQSPLSNFAFTGAIFTVTLGLRHHGSSAAVIGGAQAVIMAGGLIGAVVAPTIQRHVTVRQSVLLIALSGSLMMGVAAVIMPSPLVAVPLAIPLLLSPAANAVLFSVMLRETPEAMRGRVNNALFQVAIGLATLAPVVSGLVIQQLSARWAMGLFALALAVVVPIGLSSPALRRQRG